MKIVLWWMWAPFYLFWSFLAFAWHWVEDGKDYNPDEEEDGEPPQFGQSAQIKGSGKLDYDGFSLNDHDP